MLPSEIFDSLESIVENAEGGETIAKALENAVDIIEQKLSRGGAMIFQMRRTAGDWKRKEGLMMFDKLLSGKTKTGD